MPVAPKLLKFSTASQAVPTYSYSDIVDGLGIIRIFISQVANSTGSKHILTTQQYASALVSGDANMEGTNHTVDLTPFNSARTATGTVVISCVANTSSGNWTESIELFRVSNGVETSLGTAAVSAGTPTIIRALFEYEITETHFATGDFLRAKLIQTGNNVEVAANTLESIGNPVVDDQSFTIEVPFKIDI